LGAHQAAGDCIDVLDDGYTDGLRRTTQTEWLLIIGDEERRIGIVSEKNKVMLHDGCTTR
jgi:hypothetical protein